MRAWTDSRILPSPDYPIDAARASPYTVFLSSINGMPGALLPPLLDLFGEPLRLPTRRERQRVALQARRPAAPAPSAAPTSPRVEPAPAAVATPAPPDAANNAALPHPRLWRASELGQGATPVQPSGYRLLDAELPGGGWPLQGLIELLLPFPGSVEWRLLAPALRPLLTPPPASGLPERQLLLIGPPQAPHPRGLLPWGIGARHCLWVAPGNGPGHGRERLWTLEQALRADPPRAGRRAGLAAATGAPRAAAPPAEPGRALPLPGVRDAPQPGRAGQHAGAAAPARGAGRALGAAGAATAQASRPAA
jgi:hypothetical protein